MTDIANDSPPARADLFDRLWVRLAFWGCAAIAFLAAAVAVFAAPAAGWHGFLLLAGVTAAGFALLYVLLAGEAAVKGMERGTNAPPPAFAMAAFESARDALVVTDKRGTPVAANPAYIALTRVFHADGEDDRPAGLDRLLGGDPDASSALFRLARAAQTGQPGAADLPPLSGAGRPVTLTSRPLGHGETLWRLSETPAPESDETVIAPAAPSGAGAFADAVPAGLFSAAADGRLVFCNAVLKDWIGVSGEADELKLTDFLSGEDTRQVLQRRKGATRTEAVIRSRGGVESPAVIVTVWPEDGGPSRSVVYGESWTGVPTAPAPSEAVSEAGESQSFDDMFASAPFGVVRLDRDDPAAAVIEDANPAIVQMTGGQAQPGETFGKLFGAGVFDTLAAERNGEPVEARLTETERDAHVYFAQDGLGRWVAYIVDVSGWKDLERQLVQSQKMQAIGQLAGGVAHDFNNLLTAIRGNCDLLLERHPVGDPAYPELQNINQTVSRAAGLVRKLLAFSRKQTFRAELLDMTDLLSDLSVLLRQVLEETVKTDIVHGRDLPKVRADKGQIETALMNLATNARDAMRDQGGGTLTIRTQAAEQADIPDRETGTKPGDYLLIEVSDTGSGMDAETREKIFEPFFTTKEPGKGTGLGLATVYGIVKQSGGYLFVDSREGEGTTFRIFLPAAEAEVEEVQAMEEQVARTRAPKAPADLAGRGRILLVEDENAVRQIAAKTLTKRGYEVIEAEDGEEALELAEQYSGQIDLMVSDVVMPGLDGPGLLEAAREHLGDARVIFISGYAEEEFSDVLSREQDVRFLPKPFTLPQLAEMVKTVMAGG